MKNIIIITAFAVLVGCGAKSVPFTIKCSEGYNPLYESTYSRVTFKCVKNNE